MNREEINNLFKSNTALVIRSAQQGSLLHSGIEKVAYYLSQRGYDHNESNNWNNAQTITYIWAVRNRIMLPKHIEHFIENGGSLDTIANEIFDFYEKIIKK